MKCSNNVFKQGYLGPFAVWHNISNFFRNIKYAWQRATKGYCDRDVWDLDCYYSKIISATLNDLADNRHGYPFRLNEDEWSRLLRQAAEDFEAQLDDPTENIFTEMWLNGKERNKELHQAYMTEVGRLHRVQKRKLKSGLDFLYNYYNDLWD